MQLSISLASSVGSISPESDSYERRSAILSDLFDFLDTGRWKNCATYCPRKNRMRGPTGN
jgi:hypothetical protein